MLSRRDHQQGIARRGLGEVSGGADLGVERDAAQELVVDVVAIDVLDDLRLARPQADLAAGVAHGLRQRRPPRASPDDADAVDLQCRPSGSNPPAISSIAGGSCLHAGADGGAARRGRAASAGARAHRADRSVPGPAAPHPPRRSLPRCRCTDRPAGRESRIPCALPARAGPRASCSLAATPPATTKCRAPARPSVSAAASMARAQRSATDSVTAASKPAARSATSWSRKGASRSAARRTAVFRPAKEKCSSSRPSMGRGRSKRRGVARARETLDGRAAGEAEPQELRGLVEGFAQRVVDGGAEPLKVADAAHDEKLGMAARHQQQQVRRAQPFGQADRERVRLEVMHGDERAPAAERDRLAGDQPDDEAADQPGTGRRRDRIEVAKADARLAHRLARDEVEALDVGARGDLRHHAPVGPVPLPLRAHDVRQDAPAAVGRAPDDGGRRLVAARLEAENEALSRGAFFHGQAGGPRLR